jgi:hypothetical protein
MGPSTDATFSSDDTLDDFFASPAPSFSVTGVAGSAFDEPRSVGTASESVTGRITLEGEDALRSDAVPPSCCSSGQWMAYNAACQQRSLSGASTEGTRSLDGSFDGCTSTQSTTGLLGGGPQLVLPAAVRAALDRND